MARKSKELQLLEQTLLETIEQKGAVFPNLVGDEIEDNFGIVINNVGGKGRNILNRLCNQGILACKYVWDIAFRYYYKAYCKPEHISQVPNEVLDYKEIHFKTFPKK